MKDWSIWKQDFNNQQKAKNLKYLAKRGDPQTESGGSPSPHSQDAFCCDAGPEEMKHIQSLTDTLTDDELRKLVDAVGIKFGGGIKDVDRMTLESVVDEAAREDFYRAFHKIVESRKKS